MPVIDLIKGIRYRAASRPGIFDPSCVMVEPCLNTPDILSPIIDYSLTRGINRGASVMRPHDGTNGRQLDQLTTQFDIPVQVT